MKSFAIRIFAFVAFGQTLLAAPPQLDAVYPAGGQVGTSVDVVLQGKFDPWPCQLSFSAKGFTFTPDPEKAGTGKLQIAKDTPLGPVEVQARNAEGVSKARFFVVGKITEIAEVEEDKSAVSAAQTVDPAALPVAINGVLSALHELDAFRIVLKKGETLHAAVDGYRLRSMIDPVLQIFDREGHRLDLSHDTIPHLDPRLAFTAPADGEYTVALTAFGHPPAARIHYQGDKKSVYRLYLAKDPKQLPPHLFPEPLGGDTQGDGKITLGKPVVGTLLESGAPVVRKVTVKKGEKWLIKAEGAMLGFETDPVVRILKPDGAILRTIDDANKTPDVDYLWSVPADGEYSISISDRFRRGGPDFRYRLRLEKSRPEFQATADKLAYQIEPGKTCDIKLKVSRLHGHTAEVTAKIPDLPSALTWKDPKPAPAKNGDWVIKLEAKPDAKPFQKVLRIQLLEKPPEGAKSQPPTRVEFAYADDNSRGPYLIERSQQIWLTVLRPKKKEGEKKKPEEKKK